MMDLHILFAVSPFSLGDSPMREKSITKDILITTTLILVVIGIFLSLVLSKVVIPNIVESMTRQEVRHLTNILKTEVDSVTPQFYDKVVSNLSKAGEGSVVTIFTLDENGFKRTSTTVKGIDGKFITDTYLDSSNPAYSAIKNKTSFSGEVTIHNKLYQSHYIPLVSNDTVTGAVFVGISAEDAHETIAIIKEITMYTTIGSFVTLTLILIVLGLAQRHLVTTRLNTLYEAVKTLNSGNGDLTARLTIHRNDELGRTASVFNQFLDNIHTLLKAVGGNSTTLNSSAVDLKHIVNMVTEKIQAQNDSLAQAAAAIEEISVSTGVVSDQCKQTNHITSSCIETANNGGETIINLQKHIKDTSLAMEEIAEQTASVKDAVETITNRANIVSEIAKQTNLLALNAAIEAARAGEQGRGFAIVADEVRKLSNHSSEIAKEISLAITTLQSSVMDITSSINKEASDIDNLNIKMSKVTEAFDRLKAEINDIEISVKDISATMIEQNNANQDIAIAMEKLSQTSEQNYATINEANNISSSVSDISANLHTSVSQFKL